MNELARRYAVTAHGRQTYGDAPYEVHLRAVASVAIDYGAPSEVVTAAWLHDTLEDTETTFAELVDLFGATVANLVKAVTDKPGRSRAESHAATYSALRAAGKSAVQLKLCDRLANVRASIETSPKKLAMYRREWLFFYTTLCLPGEHEKLWAALAAQLQAPNT